MNHELQLTLETMCNKLVATYRAKPDVKADLMQEAWVACLEALGNYVPEDYDNPEQFFYFKALKATSSYYKTHNKLIKPPKKAPKAVRDLMVGKGSLTNVEALSDLLVSSYDDVDDSCLKSSDNQAQDYEDKDYSKYVASRMMLYLTTEELQVISLRYFYDEAKVMTYREVADIMSKGGTSISHVTVKAREESAIKTLKGLPEEDSCVV